jgi:hypothetical protein
MASIAGRSRRSLNGLTTSVGLRRRMWMMIDRSSIVSGNWPIPASAAMANEGNSVGTCSGPTQRIDGLPRSNPALSNPRRSSLFSAALRVPNKVSHSSKISVGG